MNRRNTRDEKGTSYYVVDAASGSTIAGPFGDDDYAFKVRERLDSPAHVWDDPQVQAER